MRSGLALLTALTTTVFFGPRADAAVEVTRTKDVLRVGGQDGQADQVRIRCVDGVVRVNAGHHGSCRTLGYVDVELGEGPDLLDVSEVTRTDFPRAMVRAEAAGDRVIGSPSLDYIEAYRGNVRGGAGSDRIRFGDLVRGGPGDDWISEGATMYGGPGDDLILTRPLPVDYEDELPFPFEDLDTYRPPRVVPLEVHGGGGNDRFTWSNPYADDGLVAGDPVAARTLVSSDRTIVTTAGEQRLVTPFTGFESLLVNGLLTEALEAVDTRRFSGGVQVLILNPRGATVRTGAADDHVHLADGPDFVDSGPGRDNVKTEGGDDLIRSRDGVRDRIACGAGNDVVIADRVDRLIGCETVRLR